MGGKVGLYSCVETKEGGHVLSIINGCQECNNYVVWYSCHFMICHMMILPDKILM